MLIINLELISPFIVECNLGLYENECKKPYDYPFYGAKYNLTCKCSKEEWHLINGCKKQYMYVEGTLLETMLDHTL